VLALLWGNVLQEVPQRTLDGAGRRELPRGGRVAHEVDRGVRECLVDSRQDVGFCCPIRVLEDTHGRALRGCWVRRPAMGVLVISESK